MHVVKHECFPFVISLDITFDEFYHPTLYVSLCLIGFKIQEKTSHFFSMHFFCLGELLVVGSCGNQRMKGSGAMTSLKR